jgi:hypothetical protein
MSVGTEIGTASIVTQLDPYKKIATPAQVKTWNDKISEKLLPNSRISPRNELLVSNAMLLIALCGSIPTLITANNIRKTQQSGGIVISAIGLSLSISLIWIVYGLFVARNAILVLSSSLLILSNIILLYYIFQARSSLVSDIKEDKDAIYVSEHIKDKEAAFQSIHRYKCRLRTKNRNGFSGSGCGPNVPYAASSVAPVPEDDDITGRGGGIFGGMSNDGSS